MWRLAAACQQAVYQKYWSDESLRQDLTEPDNSFVSFNIRQSPISKPLPKITQISSRGKIHPNIRASEFITQQMILEAAELKQAHNKYNAINTNCNKIGIIYKIGQKCKLVKVFNQAWHYYDFYKTWPAHFTTETELCLSATWNLLVL